MSALQIVKVTRSVKTGTPTQYCQGGFHGDGRRGGAFRAVVTGLHAAFLCAKCAKCWRQTWDELTEG